MELKEAVLSSVCSTPALLCFALFCFSYKNFIKKLKNQKNIKTVCVLCTLVLVYLGWPLKQSLLNFVSFVV